MCRVMLTVDTHLSLLLLLLLLLASIGRYYIDTFSQPVKFASLNKHTHTHTHIYLEDISRHILYRTAYRARGLILCDEGLDMRSDIKYAVI